MKTSTCSPPPSLSHTLNWTRKQNILKEWADRNIDRLIKQWVQTEAHIDTKKGRERETERDRERMGVKGWVGGG